MSNLYDRPQGTIDAYIGWYSPGGQWQESWAREFTDEVTADSWAEAIAKDWSKVLQANVKVDLWFADGSVVTVDGHWSYCGEE